MLKHVVDTWILTVGLGCCVFTGAAEAAERIAIRAMSLLPKEVQNVLFAVGEPTPWDLLPDETAEYAMRHHCGGSFTDHYLAQAIDLNPGLSLLQPSTKTRRISLPPCPKLKMHAAVRIRVGDDLAGLLRRELGAEPESHLLLCSPSRDEATPSCKAVPANQAVADQMGWRLEDLDVLPPGEELTLPFHSRWTVVALKEGVGIEEALTSLRDAAAASLIGENLLRVEKVRPLELIGLLSSGDPRIDHGNCATNRPVPKTWPFDQEAVREAIQANVKYLDDLGLVSTKTVVRIADTGITGIGEQHGFPERFLAENRKEIHGEGREDRDRPQNGYIGDRFGIDPDNFGRIEALRDQPDWLHGSVVADLALGGRPFRDGTERLHQLMALNFARLFEKPPGGSRILIDHSTVVNSFTAGPRFADIVNLSIGSLAPLPGLLGTLESLTDRQQIVVIAAGNDGLSLADRAMYPASYSVAAHLRPAVLVVGAHGLDGEIARFSNYGRDHVDLLAPGCLLPGQFSSSSSNHGTSLAAPLVTFTASLLRAFLGPVTQGKGGGVDSSLIKTRLSASSRFTTQEDADKTRFGGILDIPAALRVFDDVVRLRDGKLVVGRWLEPPAVPICANESSPLKSERLLRVRVEQASDPGTEVLLHVLRRGAAWRAENRERAPCKAAAASGPTLRLENGEERTFLWSEIAAFIPAHNLNDRRGSSKLVGTKFSIPERIELVFERSAPGLKSLADRAKLVQRSLAEMGINPGAVDGLLGTNTYAAIRQFQSARREQPSGVLNEHQLRALLQN